MNKLKCFQKLNMNDQEGQNDYIIAFNGTTTRAIIVKQPFYDNIDLDEDEID